MTTQKRPEGKSPHQEQFDSEFIGAAEICRELHISRPTITLAINRGQLPVPIYISNSSYSLWKRSEISQTLEDWKKTLEERRSKH